MTCIPSLITATVLDTGPIPVTAMSLGTVELAMSTAMAAVTVKDTGRLTVMATVAALATISTNILVAHIFPVKVGNNKARKAILMSTIILNGVEYTPVIPAPVIPASSDVDIRIVILQRGWVVVGYYERKNSRCYVRQASVIRNWGTTQGLGELRTGPTKKTILDPCGTVEFHELAEIGSILCDAAAWVSELK